MPSKKNGRSGPQPHKGGCSR
nr:truncated Rep protein [Porcine circovirus 2]